MVQSLTASQRQQLSDEFAKGNRAGVYLAYAEWRDIRIKTMRQIDSWISIK